jgi:choline-sulfatase
MIREDDYKLIVYPKAGVIKLFDLVNDPEEIHDLSKGARNRERIIRMFAKLEELQEEMGDTLNLRDFVYRHEL